MPEQRDLELIAEILIAENEKNAAVKSERPGNEIRLIKKELFLGKNKEKSLAIPFPL